MEFTRTRRTACCIAVLLLCAHNSAAQQATSAAATALRSRYEQLDQALAQSALQPGLYLESVERARALRADVYAIVDHSFITVRAAFAKPANWCEALILHLNVKQCHTVTRDKRTVLQLNIGEKIDQPIGDTFRVNLQYSVTASTPDYLEVNLTAKKGPLGTKDYHMSLAMIPLDDEHAFVHIQYSYASGFMAGMATSYYFAGRGKNKVGFTKVGGDKNGPARLIGGLRGGLERNTMRYYLAIDSYLGALSTALPGRFVASAERWFAATEQFALQLHEVDRAAYLTMKRSEYARQRALD